MPHLKSAFKNLRKSKKRAQQNKEVTEEVKRLLKGPVTEKTLPKIYKSIDKATKRKIYSKNKAARLKSKLAKQLAK